MPDVRLYFYGCCNANIIYVMDLIRYVFFSLARRYINGNSYRCLFWLLAWRLAFVLLYCISWKFSYYFVTDCLTYGKGKTYIHCNCILLCNDFDLHMRIWHSETVNSMIILRILAFSPLMHPLTRYKLKNIAAFAVRMLTFPVTFSVNIDERIPVTVSKSITLVLWRVDCHFDKFV